MAGPLELLETGTINEDDPQFTKIHLSDPTRGWPSQLSTTEMKRQWQSFIRHLKRYHKKETLFKQEPIWIPLINLYVPPGGSSTLKYIRSSNKKMGPEIKILGFGFGSTESISISDSVEFDAEQRGKSFLVKMYATAIRYLDSVHGQPLTRVDLEHPHDYTEHKIEDLPDITEIKSLNSEEWKVIHEINLSSSSDTGHYTFQHAITESAIWKVELSFPPLQAIGLDLNLTFESEHSKEFELTFKIPYGHDYLFYSRIGETPIVPLCTTRRN